MVTSDDDWLEAILDGLTRLPSIPARAPEDLRSLVITLLASIDATTRDASVEECTGALFLALAQLASLSEADQFEHAVIGSAYVLQLAGYPTIRRLDGVQRQNLQSLWEECSRGVETEPADIGSAIWTTFYRQT